MLKRSWLIVAIVTVVLVFFLLAQLFFFTKASTVTNYNSETTVISMPPEKPVIPADSLLTYYRFKVITDSLKRKEERQILKNKGQFSIGMQVGFIGITRINDCDTCSYSNGPFKLYLVLRGYSLHDPLNTNFYIDSDKNYLQYLKIDTVFRSPLGYIQQNGHYEKKQVPFRFSFTELGQPGAVLIPVSEGAYPVYTVLVYVLGTLVLVFLVYVVFGLPILLLIRIARGKVFIEDNIRLLHFVAWTLIIVPFAYVLLQFILKLSFHQYITNDLSLEWLDTLTNSKSSLISGIAVLIFARAFKRGYRLQKEQELTI